MSDIIDELVIDYPPLNEAQAAVLGPHLAANPAFITALLENEQFVTGLAEVLGIPERTIKYRPPARAYKRSSVRVMGGSLLQTHWGLDRRVANALAQSSLSIPEMVAADQRRLSTVRNLGDKYIRIVMDRRKPIPYRALRFDAKALDKAMHLLQRLSGPLRISYAPVDDSVIAFTIETYDRAVEVLNTNQVVCHEVAVSGDPLRVIS